MKRETPQGVKPETPSKSREPQESMALPERPDAPSPESVRRARTHWQLAGESLRQAQKEHQARHFIQGGFLSLQAAQNALNTLCQLQGHILPPLHSPSALSTLVTADIPALEGLIAPCHALEAVQGLNPFAGQRDDETEQAQSKQALDHAQAVLTQVRAYLKAHRKRFFAP
ncbi:MAG: hypothetical protein OEW39_11235 [Deltaproteobacteria bacterium]|nr:hypothetical protein [Deltaproteobacteria bacterium]